MAPISGRLCRLARAAGVMATLSASLVGRIAAAQPSPPPSAAQGAIDPSAEAPLEPGVLALFVNGQPAGESFVLFRGEDVLVPVADLRAAGLVRLRAATEAHGDVDYVSMQASPVLRAALDMDELALRVEAPSELFERSVIDLASRPPPEMRYVRSTSLFFNYAPRLVDGTHFSGYGEAGLVVGPTLVWSAMSHDEVNGSVRLMSRVTFDDRASRRRVTLGDAQVTSGPLGGGAMLGGVAVATNLDLDPYLVRFPSLGLGGGVTTPSTLDVYVNDTLVRSVPVAPGEFEVQNLPPTSGAGTTRYVLRDAFGNQQAVQSSYYATSGLLAPGLADYSYAVGFVRERFGVASFDYGRPALLARHRYGFSRKVSAGARLELDATQVSGGVAVTLAPGRGELEIVAGGSGSFDGGGGAAAQVGYSYRGRRLAMGTSVRAISSGYTTLSLGPNDPRVLFEHATSASVAFSSWGSMATRVTYGLTHGHARPDARIDALVNARIGEHLNVVVSASARHGADGIWQEEATATLRAFLPAHHSISAGSRVTSEGDVEATAQVARPVSGRFGAGYRITGTEGTTQHLNAAFSARTPYGNLDASYDDVDGDRHVVVNGAVGLALVPGEGVFFRGPVQQSYAIVHVPGVARVRTYLNNQEVGRTNRRGRLFVPGLLPYQANRLRVEMADLSMDYELDADEQVVAPTDRGAARVTFAARRVRLARGRIVFGEGDGARPARYGEVRVSVNGGVLASPLGIGGELELEGLLPGAWRAEVRSPEGACSLSLEVPESAEPIVDLGILRCPEPTETTP
jgi:outer membrane usher protein